MKKIFYIILIALFPTTTAWAAVGDTFTANNLKYKVTSESPKTATLTGYVSKPTDALTIPATVNGYAVTNIGDDAFKRCKGLTSVVLPEGLISIGNNAFSSCSKLASVNIPNSVSNIGSGAFGYSALTSVTIPEGVTSIGDNTFFYCDLLTSVNIPASVTNIGNGAFGCCLILETVTIPEGVTNIGHDAFLGCQTLTEVSIPTSVKSIGDNAFESCSGLKEINIYAKSLTTYGKDAFKNTPAGIKINVFDGCADDYKAGWADYSAKIGEYSADDLTVVGVSANQNPSLTSDNWATYFHPAANTKVKTSDVEIYIATLGINNTYVNLTKVEGNNIIKAGQAVMLKAADAGALSLELTPDAATGDYTGNDLKGGSAVAAGKIAYTLAAKNNRMGFYKFAGSALNPNKAHLELPTSASIRELIALDEETVTSINVNVNVNDNPNDDDWYTLDGKKMLNGKPSTVNSKPRIYIHNGRKEVVR